MAWHDTQHRSHKHCKRVLLNIQDNCCAYCGIEIAGHKATLDHIIPISFGGDNNLCNLVALCHTCNKEKGSMLPQQLARMQRRQLYEFENAAIEYFRYRCLTET